MNSHRPTQHEVTLLLMDLMTWQMEQYQRRVAELTAAGERWATWKVRTV